jgi:hypothetical protein
VKRLFITGVVSFLIVLILSISADAFDGKRKGFVAGLGGGWAPVIHWSGNYLSSDVDRTGWGINYLMGYAWNDWNIIAYEGIGWIYELPQSSNDFSIYALDGIRWYHYFGKRYRLFSSLGVGLFLGSAGRSELDVSGFGATVGIGYEFLKQLQIGVYYVAAHSTGHSEYQNDIRVTTNHSIVGVLLTLVAY